MADEDAQADVAPQYYIQTTTDNRPIRATYVYKVPSRSFNLKFKVKCAHNAYVKLSQTNNPSLTEPVLEIYIGGFLNQQSAIRDLMEFKEWVATPGILSKEEFRGFWIKYHEGAITVGKENEVEPFLTWTDPEPINVAYFGVCSAAAGEWVVSVTGYVASLQSACSDVILQHIQKPLVSSISLPKILKDYLLYEICIISSSAILSPVKGEETKPQADVVPQYYILETLGRDKYMYNKVPSRSFNLKFKVKCAHNARIRLSQTNNPSWTDPVLEIYFGAEGNQKSVIYRDFCNNMAEVATPGILSKEEFRGFWIKYHEGTITVGKENEVEPFLTWTDPAPINVAYFGVRSDFGAPGEWVVSVTGSVASLQSACRDVILQHIQKPRVSSLPLPKILKDYLLYET